MDVQTTRYPTPYYSCAPLYRPYEVQVLPLPLHPSPPTLGELGMTRLRFGSVPKTQDAGGSKLQVTTLSSLILLHTIPHSKTHHPILMG